jgi:hypothetical protein
MDLLKPKTVRERMWFLNKRKNSAEKALKDILEQIRQEEVELIKRCPHETVQYCMGSSYDHSTYSCTACGEDIIPTSKTKILK